MRAIKKQVFGIRSKNNMFPHVQCQCQARQEATRPDLVVLLSQKRPFPQQPHHGTLPEAVLSCRAGVRLRRLRGSQRDSHRDEDSEEPVVEPLLEAPDAVVPDMVPEERLSAASSQRHPLPQQPHHGTLPESTLSLRMEERRRRPEAVAARHADT